MWSTFYGGSKANSDQFPGGGLEMDTSGRVWFTGMSNSLDLPMRNPAQPAYGWRPFDAVIIGLKIPADSSCH